MTNRTALAAVLAATLGFGHCAASAEPQHAPPAGHPAPAAAGLAMPAKDDVHVVALYELVKDVRAKGAASVDHDAMMAKLKGIAHGHATEVGADPAQMEAHIMEVMHNAYMAAEADPHVLDSIDTFQAALHKVMMDQHAAAAPAANPHGGQAVTQTLQPGAAEWKASPYMREFYEATKAAFANGPKKVDAKAFDTTSKEIFTRFADSMGADRKGMLDHLKDIPTQIVQIAKEDPKVLDSYDNFWVALSGPE